MTHVGFVSFQASYEEISAAVKEAADGPMKGILGWTDEEVGYKMKIFKIKIKFSGRRLNGKLGGHSHDGLLTREYSQVISSNNSEFF